jgi:6-phospho-beta-glucosidase
MKITVVGGGGFRAPIAWESIAEIAVDISVDEVVLYDPDAVRLARVDAVIEGLRMERGGGPEVKTTTDLPVAVDGADVVFCAIRVGGLPGRIVDETVPLREGVLGQETVGPGGICFALRTVPAMLDIARAVADRSPKAWFLNFTNPAGLVSEAVRAVLGERVVGICDSPVAMYRRVANALDKDAGDLVFDYAGLNHLGWLLAVGDGSRDILPDLLLDDARLSSVDEARLFGVRRLRELGLIPNEYLVYYESHAVIVDAFRRAGATRAEVLVGVENTFYGDPNHTPAGSLAAWRRARDLRFGTYMAEVEGARRDSSQATEAGNRDGAAEAGSDPTNHGGGAARGPEESGYAAVAAAFVRAVGTNSGEMLTLNVANNGRLPNLDDDAVVEVTCRVTTEGPSPLPGRPLPDEQRELVGRIKDVERLTIDAAVRGRRDLALRALATHPVVGSEEAAGRILAGYLAAFPDLAARLR